MCVCVCACAYNHATKPPCLPGMRVCVWCACALRRVCACFFSQRRIGIPLQALHELVRTLCCLPPRVTRRQFRTTERIYQQQEWQASKWRGGQSMVPCTPSTRQSFGMPCMLCSVALPSCQRRPTACTDGPPFPPLHTCTRKEQPIRNHAFIHTSVKHSRYTVLFTRTIHSGQKIGQSHLEGGARKAEPKISLSQRAPNLVHVAHYVDVRVHYCHGAEGSRHHEFLELLYGKHYLLIQKYNPSKTRILVRSS